MKKQRWEESEKRRERVRRNKIKVREKAEKPRNTVFFQCFVAPEGREESSPKRRVRSHLGRWKIEKCAALWREADLEVNMWKHLRLGALLEVQMWKKHTPLWHVVARSTCRSQNGKNTTCSDKPLEVRCSKRPRRCGAKHVSKSKHSKHLSFGTLLDVEILQKCRPLWREANFEVKMVKAPHARAAFGG